MILTAGSFSSSRVKNGLFSQSAPAAVRTSVLKRSGYVLCRSRTAAVSMTTSPGEWKLRKIRESTALRCYSKGPLTATAQPCSVLPPGKSRYGCTVKQDEEQLRYPAQMIPNGEEAAHVICRPTC